MTQLYRLGYRCARVSASGQRKGSRKEQSCIAGDLIAFASPESGLPHLICEVGGEKKSCRKALAELTRDPLPPGFAAVVARCVNRRWRWHIDEDGGLSLGEALEALRNA